MSHRRMPHCDGMKLKNFYALLCRMDVGKIQMFQGNLQEEKDENFDGKGVLNIEIACAPVQSSLIRER